MTRQSSYGLGTGWSGTRGPSTTTRSTSHGSWAVRLDASRQRRSDGRHEREWRVPHQAFPLAAGSVVAVLVGQPNWQPWGSVLWGGMIDPETGRASFQRAVPQTMPFTEPPPQWGTVQRWYWDAAGQVFQLPH